MSRARFQDPEDWQTAVASETGSGCLPFYALALLLIYYDHKPSTRRFFFFSFK